MGSRLLAGLGLWLIALAACSQVSVAQDDILDPDARCPARRTDCVTYDVDFSVVVTPPAGTSVLRVWLPVPQSDGIQRVSDYRVTTRPLSQIAAIETELLYGNRFSYVEYESPLGAQIVRQRYRIAVPELYWGVDPDLVVTPDAWPAAFDRYRRNEQNVVVDARARALAEEIVPETRGIAHDMFRIMDWIMENMSYDPSRCSLRASSVWAVEERCGTCSDYHGLAAALGRALGYATRVTYGIAPYPKGSPSHCKLEVFLPPYGWVSFDVSTTQKLIHKIREAPELTAGEKVELEEAARARLFAGFRDNTWYRTTNGTDYDVAPAASSHVPLVRTAYIEADGIPLPDPDPAAPAKREFAWMTVHSYSPSRPVSNPLSDWRSLLPGYVR